MKSKLALLCAKLFIIASCCVQAAEHPQPNPHPASAELERMKTLAGTWQGKTDMGQGPVEMTVTYRVIAGGSVVEERVFPGTPQEMVTMYHDKNGKLSLTHYCVLGNQPVMALKASDAKTLTFDFDASCCTIDPKKESHMHAMTLSFDDADTLTSTAKAIFDGKETPACSTTLKRVKTTTAASK